MDQLRLTLLIFLGTLSSLKSNLGSLDRSDDGSYMAMHYVVRDAFSLALCVVVWAFMGIVVHNSDCTLPREPVYKKLIGRGIICHILLSLACNWIGNSAYLPVASLMLCAC